MAESTAQPRSRADWLAQLAWAAGGVVLAIVAFRILGLGSEPELDRSLLAAAQRGRVGELRELVARGADPNAATPEGWTALHYAAYLARDDAAEALLSLGAQVDARSANGQTPLFRAAMAGDVAIAKRLLARGASPVALAASGETPLAAALSTNHVDVAIVLLEHGAEPEIRDATTLLTPLLYAAKRGKPELARALVEAGADLEARAPAGETPLILAARAGDLACAELLLEAGADPNASALAEHGGASALHEAAARTDAKGVELVRALLARGADRELRNAAGESAFDVARAAGATRSAELLRPRS